ncbi:DUF2975 domain-containing protein [Microbacterium sp.]|uniref:DUF2975 domain-containing protein n=1 Tax=Microbacterium sp. TaxID=51671 RepID=UPI003F9DCD4E
MQPRVTAVLKTLIAVMILLLLVAQIAMIPAVAEMTALQNPDLAFLRVPGIIGGVLFLLLVQIVLLCIWKLLSLVRGDKIFSPHSFRYVDVIIGAMIAAAVLLTASIIVIYAARAVNPGILLLGVLGVVVGIALALLVVVMRGLLRKALELEQDLSEVV